MPHITIFPGTTGNIGTNQVPGNLQIIGVAVPYTISIGGSPAVAHTVAVGAVDNYVINNRAVTIVNNSALGIPAGNLAVTY
ncbi:hypothetical protein FNW52_10815 [Flavobacterium sp. ZT3R18]|uniref:hypothetical protein n=1 Tax=Flavobacterium sp. ZT3R18 TaxID=2594429 RepID=UPI00117B0880|nr:hypothetical protein [Flavobacterium sp. ZT3R18]TRX35523.1 hypothetical protein FNW52_10815 [Flavobacterium sp. ZT3R18]